MENKPTFFELTGEEASSVGILCVSIANEIMENEKHLQLQPDLMDAFETLKSKLFAMNEIHADNITLNSLETFAFQHAYVQCAYRVKGHLLLPPEERKTTKSDPEIESIYEILQENAPNLLWRITQKMGYNTYGLDTLEKVFDIKTGVVRQLEVDNTEEYSTLSFDEQNHSVIHYCFNLVDSLEPFQDESDFLKNLYGNKFMNMSDFREVFPKIMSAKLGDEISLTMRDNIILYWAISLTRYMFVTEVADIIESVGKSITMESYKRFREFVLRYCAVLLNEMDKGWSEDTEMTSYFNKVKEWGI